MFYLISGRGIESVTSYGVNHQCNDCSSSWKTLERCYVTSGQPSIGFASSLWNTAGLAMIGQSVSKTAQNSLKAFENDATMEINVKIGSRKGFLYLLNLKLWKAGKKASNIYGLNSVLASWTISWRYSSNLYFPQPDSICSRLNLQQSQRPFCKVWKRHLWSSLRFHKQVSIVIDDRCINCREDAPIVIGKRISIDFCWMLRDFGCWSLSNALKIHSKCR